jgi:hypothetical protein
MLLRPLGAKFAGTGVLIRMNGSVFGGALVSSNSVNAVTVTISDKKTGEIIFDVTSLQPMFFCAPIQCGGNELLATCSGTGGIVQLFEWVN